MHYAKTIAERTGAGKVLVGLLLNTLLGGVSAVMATVAVVDAAVRERPFSADVARPVVLLQGTLVVLFLVVAAAAITVGDILILSALPLRDRPRLVTTTGEFHSTLRQLDRLAEEGLEIVEVDAEPVDQLAERLARDRDR